MKTTKDKKNNPKNTQENFRKIYARFLLDGVKELYYTKSYEQKEYKKGYYPERI